MHASIGELGLVLDLAPNIDNKLRRLLQDDDEHHQAHDPHDDSDREQLEQVVRAEELPFVVVGPRLAGLRRGHTLTRFAPPCDLDSGP